MQSPTPFIRVPMFCCAHLVFRIRIATCSSRCPQFSLWPEQPCEELTKDTAGCATTTAKECLSSGNKSLFVSAYGKEEFSSLPTSNESRGHNDTHTPMPTLLDDAGKRNLKRMDERYPSFYCKRKRSNCVAENIKKTK
jgi:hypothetical protein